MRLQSTFAILDVMRGRRSLEKALKSGQSIPVVIEAEIVRPWGSDDGVSIEFELRVKSVRVVDAVGIEPTTPAVSRRCSPAELRIRSENDTIFD